MRNRLISFVAVCLLSLGAVAAQPLLGFYDNEMQNNTPAREAWLKTPIMFTWNGGSPSFFVNGAPHWHMQPMVDWLNARPHRQMVYSLGMFRSASVGQSQTLAACAAGAYDTDYTNVAKAFAQYGIKSNIFRIGWEFTGTWYSWRSIGHEADYAACYRHIVQVMRATVPDNKWKFDWNPTADAKAPTLNATYPGDDVVDYVTMDIYDTSRNVKTAYPYPADCDAACRLTRQKANWNNILYELKYILSPFAKAHGKKIGFSEWGVWSEAGVKSSTPGGGDDPYFIQQMHDYIANPANNVAYSVYFESSPSDGDHALCCSPSETEFPQSSVLFQKLFGKPIGLSASSVSQPTVAQGGSVTASVTLSSNVSLPNGKLSLRVRNNRTDAEVLLSVTNVDVIAGTNVFSVTLKLPANVPAADYYVEMGVYDQNWKIKLYVKKIATFSVASSS